MESAHDLIAALTASTQDVDKEAPAAKQDCYDRVKVALFFDGTGNNRDADAAAKKWSNVARLYDASRREPENGIYAYYISGVGTKLNRKEPWWELGKYVRDSSFVGGGVGAGADRARHDIGGAILRLLIGQHGGDLGSRGAKVKARISSGNRTRLTTPAGDICTRGSAYPAKAGAASTPSGTRTKRLCSGTFCISLPSRMETLSKMLC